MKKRDLYIILLVLAAALGARYLAGPKNAPVLPPKTEAAAATEAPTEASAEAPAGESENAQAQAKDNKIRPAQSFLRIQVGSETYRIVPLNKKDTVEVRQPNGAVNLVDIDVNAFKMHSSTCKNQECIHQGEVTLENYRARPLYNTVVCLPNKVLLELLSPEEAARASGLAR